MTAGEFIKDLTALKAGKWALRAVTRHPVIAVAAGGIFLGYKFWQKRSSESTNSHITPKAVKRLKSRG